MSSTQRSSQSFCARPGCGLAKSMHGYSTAACANFIQPGSKEANALKRPALSVVETPAPECPLSPEACAKRKYSDCSAHGTNIDEEETVETPTLSDAELLEEWKARALVLGVLA